MNTIYNNENEDKFSELKKDLKELPKVNAPENFEYNLMTQIKNKNFGKVEETRPNFSLIKFLAPSAVVVAAVILFFIFLPASNQNNIQQTNPSQKLDSPANFNKSLAEKKTATDQKITIPANSDQSSASSIANNIPTRVKTRIPISNDPRAIKLDDYISGESANQKDLGRGNIVNGGNDQSEPDGFFIKGNPDSKTLAKYRAKLDSVKKAQMKADSLKKIQKDQ